MGEYGGRDSLEKEKYLANSYNAAKVNVNYKLSSFFKCYFRSETEILMEVCSFWIISTNHFLRWDFIFQWMGGSFSVGDSFLGGDGTPLGLHQLWLEGGGIKKFMEWEVPQSYLFPLEQTLLCVVTGLKRSMNYNMVRKIYKRRILTL